MADRCKLHKGNRQSTQSLPILSILVTGAISVFDLSTGIYKSGRTQYADGTVRVDPQDA